MRFLLMHSTSVCALTNASLMSFSIAVQLEIIQLYTGHSFVLSMVLHMSSTVTRRNFHTPYSNKHCNWKPFYFQRASRSHVKTGFMKETLFFIKKIQYFILEILYSYRKFYISYRKFYISYWKFYILYRKFYIHKGNLEIQYS